ncbi:MAG TPA: glycogen/starch synthase, partial [Chitinophagales bacterium]|nr:glycogen/starch synthase [Chitinophagales bacterium]
MEKKRILIVTQEMEPYLIESGVGKITSGLPQYIFGNSMDVRVLMPRFGNINERRNRLHEVVRLSGINISVGDEDYPLIIKVASLPGIRLQVYFLDNEELFERKAVFRDKKNEFFTDNEERMIFFCKGVIETVRKFGWPPHILHCHGWMTSLIPYYLKTQYKDDPVFRNTKVIYSIYENEFTESFSKEFPKKIVSSHHDKKIDIKYYDKANNTALNLGGTAYSDAVIIGSKKIAKEVSSLISKNGKPVLEYQPESSYKDAYQKFYQSLL